MKVRAAGLSALMAAVLVGGTALVYAPPVVPEAHADSTLYINSPFQTEGGVNASEWSATGRQGNNTSANPPVVRRTNSIPSGGYGDPYNTSWLTLTDDDTRGGWGSSGSLVNKTPFSSTQGVVLEFDMRIWRTQNGMVGMLPDPTGGDGMSVYLVDANIDPDSSVSGASGSGISISDDIYAPGGYGAGLGYSSAAGVDKGLWESGKQQGVAGGYIGVGFDVWGNFGNYSAAPDLNWKAERTRPPIYPNTTGQGQTGSPVLSNGNDTNQSRKGNTIGLRGSGVRHDPAPGAGTGSDDYGNFNYSYGMSAWNANAMPSGQRWHGGYRWLGGKTLPSGTSIENEYQDASVYKRARVSITPEASGNHTVTVEMSNPLKISEDVCAKVNLLGQALTDPSGNLLTQDRSICMSGTGTDGIWVADPANVQMVQQFQYTLGNPIDGYDLQANIPENFQIGFGASTGYAVDYHQIRNVRVSALADPAVTKKIAYLDANKNVTVVPAGYKSAGCDTSTNYCDNVETRAGNWVEYQIDLSNNGPSNLVPAFPAKLTDGLSALPLTDIEWKAEVKGSDGQFRTSTDGTNWTDWQTSGSTDWADGDLPQFDWIANATGNTAVTVSIRAKVTDAAITGTWSNTAAIQPNTEGGPQDTNLMNNADSASFYVPPAPKWTVEKASNPASGSTVKGGDPIVYTVEAKSNDTKNPEITSTTIYYQKNIADWDNVYMHYCSGVGENCTWTALPGVQMSPSSAPSGLGGDNWYSVTLNTTGPITAAFHELGGSWDNNNGQNYSFNVGGVSTGTWALVGVNSPTIAGISPQKLSDPTIDVVNVEKAYIVDNMTEVLENSNGPTAVTLKVGSDVDQTIHTGLSACPAVPSTATNLCATWPTAGDPQLIVGGFDIPAGQTAVLKYTMTVKADVAPGQEWQNLALGNASNGLPQQCAVGSFTLTSENIDQPCFAIHRTSEQTLTLVKKVQNPDGVASYQGPDNWRLTAAGAESYTPINGVIPNVTVDGDDAALATAAIDVRPGTPLTLSEQDVTAAPTYAASQWACVGTDAHGDPVDVTLSGAVVTVASDTDVTCTITNSTAELSLLKKVDDEEEPVFVAGDFKLSASADTAADLPELNGVDGDVEPTSDNSMLVLPGETYTASEESVSGNLAYLQKDFQVYTPGGTDCPAAPADWATVWDADCWETVDASDVSVDAGERGVYRFVNAKATAPTLPVTGGMGAFIFTIVGLVLIGGASALVVSQKRRNA